MQAQKADWVEMNHKTGGSHGSVFPVVKFVNAYDEIILDASDTETLSSFPEADDIGFLNNYTCEACIRTTNARVMIEALKTSLSKLKVGETKKARELMHPLSRGMQYLQMSLEHHEKEL